MTQVSVSRAQKHFFLLLRLTYIELLNLSRIVRKPDFCLCENKGADQLRSNGEADQRHCFRYTDSTISLLHISKASSALDFVCTAWFVSYLVGNPICWFSNAKAHILNELICDQDEVHRKGLRHVHVQYTHPKKFCTS